MPVISVNRVVDLKRIIRKMEGRGGVEAQGVADPQKRSSLIIWPTSVINKKLPKVNSQPIGENSPNLAPVLQNLFFTNLHVFSYKYV
jgi:hypothetical protein